MSVLISLDQELSENVWFVWSKTSYSGDVTMRDGRTDGRTREDNATQPLDAGRLSFAILETEFAIDAHYLFSCYYRTCGKQLMQNLRLRRVLSCSDGFDG